MREQLEQYVNLLFAGSQDAEDMRQEILQNTLDRYDDLVTQGKSPEAAYRLAIAGIGDVNELFGGASPAPMQNQNVDHRGRPLPTPKKKMLRAVGIGLYICCVIPVIALGDIGNGLPGVCLMLLMVAIATVLMMLSSGSVSKEAAAPAQLTAKQELRKAVQNTLSTVALVLFLVVSFLTGAWHITWLIFPIMGAVRGIVFACMDLKEANEK